mmetsp:Transcript_13364/g.20303  ORF Transcript_13364/g.20303 Transcript_13364/m.20303 type:complete len:114 (+) Transcript_13364:169-510(+)
MQFSNVHEVYLRILMLDATSDWTNISNHFDLNSKINHKQNDLVKKYKGIKNSYGLHNPPPRARKKVCKRTRTVIWDLDSASFCANEHLYFIQGNKTCARNHDRAIDLVVRFWH